MREPLPRLDRRHFILGVVGAVGGGLVVGCAKPDRKSRVQSFVLAPEQSLQGQNVWFATASAHVDWGESVVVRTVDGRAKKVEGNPAFPINRGKTHVRSQAGVQSLYHPDRIKWPMRRRGSRGDADFESIGWLSALNMLVEKLGPPNDPILITGRIAGTKARIASSLMNSLGGRHLVYEPLETTSLRESIRRVFGVEQTPHFDIGNARYVLSFGADFLGMWVSPVQYSLAYSHFRHGEGRERGLLTQIEPRMSMTGSNADRWFYINPGHEGAVALSIAHVIVNEGLVSEAVWGEALEAVGGREALARYAPDTVAGASGVSAESIETIAREFASHQPGIAIAGGPALAQTNGSNAGAAVLLLNRIAGSVGEVGGVLPNPAPPSAVLSPLAPTPYSEFASLAGSASTGGPRSIFVYDADPAYGLPEAAGFKKALAEAGFIASMSTFMNETSAYADLILPSTHPFEEWGDFAVDAANGRRVVGYQQPVVSPQTDSRSFGDVLLAIAPELTGEGAAQSQTMHEAVKSSAIELFGDVDLTMSPDENWIELLRRGGYWEGGSQPGRFSSLPDWSIDSLQEPSFAGDAAQFPLRLVPFETVSVGAGAEAVNPWLQAAPDPLTTVTWTTWVEINPHTAEELGLKRGDLVDVVTPTGEKIRAGIYDSPVVPPDVIGIPVGGGREQGGRWDVGQGANVLSILSPQVDSATGALAWAATRATLRKVGKNRELPTFEFFDNPRNDEEGPPVKVTRE